MEEFEQLALSLTNCEHGFHSDDIDRIVSLAYNYGVTLVDLEQVQLAEKFVSKAINLLHFASSAMKSWLPRMQVSFFIISMPTC